MSNGWIKLHRDILEKPIWTGSTPEQKTILITLLMMANHQTKEWEWRGQKFKARPGQFVTSLPSIVEKSGKQISIQNVRTSLKRFEKLEFLTDESTKQNRLITLVNWEVYQKKDKDLTDELTDNQQTTNSQLTANKKVIKKEPIKNTVHDDELFEIWWTLYNNKTGRAKCIAKYKSLLKKYSHETMIDGTEKYLQHRKGLAERNEFLPQQKNPLTFLNGEHFNDEYGQASKQTDKPIYKPLIVDYSKGED